MLNTPTVPRRTRPSGTSKHPKGAYRNPIIGYFTKHPLIWFFEVPLKVPNMKHSELPFSVPRGTISLRVVLIYLRELFSHRLETVLSDISLYK